MAGIGGLALQVSTLEGVMSIFSGVLEPGRD